MSAMPWYYVALAVRVPCHFRFLGFLAYLTLGAVILLRTGKTEGLKDLGVMAQGFCQFSITRQGDAIGEVAN